MYSANDTSEIGYADLTNETQNGDKAVTLRAVSGGTVAFEGVEAGEGDGTTADRA